MAKVITQGDPYENLANAIVLVAVEDYRKALKRWQKNAENKMAAAEVEELERFFRSGWYSILTSVNGEFLIKKIRKEYCL